MVWIMFKNMFFRRLNHIAILNLIDSYMTFIWMEVGRECIGSVITEYPDT